MIYLVTNNPIFHDCDKYKLISVEKSLELLEPLKLIGFDTETQGLDCHVDKLLSMQLGCYDFQIVIDCLTVSPQCYKALLESEEHLFLGWNLKFDGKFLLTHGIIPTKFYDGFLAEKLLYLGWPSGIHSLSLKSAGEHYLGIELDKSIRGEIIYKGLVPEVIEYAANDVKYLEQIILKQREELKKKDLLKAIEVENQFLIPLTYIEWCGVKLDVEKWKAKMVKDKEREEKALAALNKWFLDEFNVDNPELPYERIDAYLFKTNPEYSDAPEYCWGYEDKDGYLFVVPEEAVLVQEEDIEETTISGCKTTKHGVFNWYKDNLLKNVETLRKKYIFRDFQGDLFTGFNTEVQVSLNWNSAKQLIPIFKAFGVKVSVKDKKTGEIKDSIDAKILKPQKAKCSLIPLYLEYCKAVKVTSTYGENFLKQINPITGRIHTNFQQMGADTTRITSGGKDKGSNKEYVNLLNLPKNSETRNCFIAEDLNRWISIDYSGQETYLMASISNDKAILDELNNGCGDIHSLTAYISYPEIPRETPIKDIKKLFPKLRDLAKKIEFGTNYGGNAKTISENVGIPQEEADRIYKSYMSGFKGLQEYQKFRRRDWWDKGYILLSPITGHKVFIYDWESLKEDRKSFNVPGFWDNYRTLKETSPECETVQRVKHFFMKKSDYERASINYPIQAAGSFCLRLALIYFFEYLRQNDLVFKVKISIIPYDEGNCEAPAEIADQVADKLHECMVEAGKYFCTRCKLDADISYLEDGTLPTYWVHE